MKNLKKRAFLFIFAALFALCVPGKVSFAANPGLKVGDPIPNPNLKFVTRYETDAAVEYRMQDFKQDRVMLVAFMPTISKANNYADVMTSAFETYFSDGLSFRSFADYMYANPNLSVLVITPDKNFELRDYMNQKNINFNMVSDEKLEIAQSFGISGWDKSSAGSFVYIVGADNKVIYANDNYKGEGEKLKAVQSVLFNIFGLKENTEAGNFSTLMAGDNARDFEFSYVTGDITASMKPYSLKGKLSDYKGKKNVLIAFYPAAYSYSCAIEVSKIDHWAEDRMIEKVKNSGLNTDDLEILMVSVSNDYILSKWGTELNLHNVKLVNDAGGNISKMYNSFNGLGFNNRTVFLVNKEGVVSYINWNYQVDDKDFDQLKDQVLAVN